jgi:phospholipase/carboxylesterase
MTLETITVNPQNGQNPEFVFVLLHGWGANYNDLSSFASLFNFPNCQFLFPNAPFPHYQVPGGRAWYALENNNEGIEESLEQFYSWLIGLEDKTNVPLSHTVVGGFSQGGAMSLDVGLQLPVAGICSLSGYLHFQPKADRNPFPPTLICHGKLDPVVPIASAREAKEKLEKVGVKVEYHEYDMAHEVIPTEINIIRQFVTNLFLS